MGHWVGHFYHASYTGEAIDRFVAIEREQPLSVFQRRAAQVKREAMLDAATRKCVNRGRFTREMLIWLDGPISDRPIEVWLNAGTAGSMLVANIREEFARMERTHGIARLDTPFMKTATKPGDAS